jgi:hypothetical protein
MRSRAGVTAWRDVERAEPGFAQPLFDAHRHQTIAGVRAGGSPRISGIEPAFEDGEPRLTRLRGPRRGGPARPTISGRAIPAGAIEGPDGGSFRADIAVVGHTRLNEDAAKLAVEWWAPGHGCQGSAPSDR